ncbi:MAG: hypothetical protein JKY96_03105 [Phycisphaerales bacterium]|nr:hypothetical protein [Phycisphaerales bacterium]
MASKHSAQPVILPTQVAHSWGDDRHGYFSLSMRPLHILVFLLPIIVYYEIGLLGWIGGENTTASLTSHELLSRFFEVFGVLGLHLPAIALVVTLLLQHLFTRKTWRIRPMVLLAMIAESAFLTGPLIILWMVLNAGGGGGGVATESEALAAVTGQGSLFSSEFQHRLMIAMGAGLYEEMLFRLVLITMLHFLVTDVLRFNDKAGKIIGVVGAALAFLWIHDQIHLSTGGVDLRLAAFILISGIYLGVLFLVRGFGIAVGVHLMWDLLAFVILPGFRDMGS